MPSDSKSISVKMAKPMPRLNHWQQSSSNVLILSVDATTSVGVTSIQSLTYNMARLAFTP
jgi:hypothetical protein